MDLNPDERMPMRASVNTIREYEQWLRSWASPRTTEERVKVIRARIREWGDPTGWTIEQAQEWLGRDTKAWTRSTYHAHLTDFCAWLHASGRTDHNLMNSLRLGKRPRSLPRPLTEAEVEKVLGAATGNMRTWILLALLAGLRAHEIAKIRGEDVQPDAIYVEGKGGTRYLLPTHPELWEVAQQYPRRGPWFPGRSGVSILPDTITTQVGAFFRGQGIPRGSIHRVRHTYGTRLLRSGANIRVVQQLMRHSSLATTATYTAVDEDELRSAIVRLSA